jgi:hypothetical protein
LCPLFRGKVSVALRHKGEYTYEGIHIGDVLATCVFRANSEVIGELSIRALGATGLKFFKPESEKGLWNITNYISTDE